MIDYRVMIGSGAVPNSALSLDVCENMPPDQYFYTLSTVSKAHYILLRYTVATVTQATVTYSNPGIR